MALGTVKFFNATKGFGFITPDEGSADTFMHASSFQSPDMEALAIGERVAYDIESDSRGVKAINIRRASQDAGVAAGVAGTARAKGEGAALMIYHNPACNTSCNVLKEIRAAGYEPRIVEYLKTPPTRDELKSLARRMAVPAMALARTTESLFGELRLDDQAVTEDEILDAMAAHPSLINRPIVATNDAAKLCRPSALAKAFLRENAADRLSA
jgi:arsenate reductase